MKTFDMDEFLEGDGEGGGRRPRGPRRPMRPPFELKRRHVFGLVAGIAVLVIVIMAMTGRLGVTNISHDQVAVKVNYLTGKHEVIATPGYVVYMPFIQEVFPLDRTPQKFLMEGDRVRDDNHVPFLTVRALDGSNFWFESLEIQYAILPAMADRVLEDSGPDQGFKRDWIRAYARSVLRDEFGKFSAVEVADPSNYQLARIECTRRLNEYLEPHGIGVIDIITPKPRFDAQYEAAIEESKTADQSVKRMIEEEKRLRQEQQRRLSGVEKEKSIELEGERGELARMKYEAEREAIHAKRAADAYAVERLASGTAERIEKVANARGLREKYTKEAAGMRARAEALEKRGTVVVREALIEKLASIRFTLIPYSRDPQPKRLEHIDGRAASSRLVDEETIGGDNR